MMPYSIEPRDQIFVKGSGFLYFVKNMNKYKNISKNSNSKTSKNFLMQMRLKLREKRAIQKRP